MIIEIISSARRSIILAALILGLVTDATSPPQNNFTVTDGEITCIVITAGLRLTIPYTGQSQDYTATIDVDTNATSTGLCGNTQDIETLNIRFYDNWNLTFIFNAYEDSSSNISYFYIGQISLEYKQDSTHFPNSDKNVTILSVYTHLDNDTLRGSINGSYQCQTNYTVSLNNSIILTLFNIQYRAFGTDNSTWFRDSSVSVCPVEKMIYPETDVEIAVAVGIALGVMIVTVFLLYCVISKAKGKAVD